MLMASAVLFVGVRVTEELVVPTVRDGKATLSGVGERSSVCCRLGDISPGTPEW